MLGTGGGSSASHNDGPAALTASVQKEDSGMIDAEAMNSVTEKKGGRPPILTKDVMAGIPVLVQQGLNAEAIAARLGCTVSTLKVRCSQAQISLRVPKEVKVVPLAPLVPALTPPEPPKQKRPMACRADHAATQPRCDVPAAPASGSNRHDRSRTCYDPA